MVLQEGDLLVIEANRTPRSSVPQGADDDQHDRVSKGVWWVCARAQAPFMDAVVKVYCVHTEPNFSLPWQRKRQYASTSSGFMVQSPGGQRWLLTNAHSVEYHSQVRRGAPCLPANLLLHGKRLPWLSPGCLCSSQDTYCCDTLGHM